MLESTIEVKEETIEEEKYLPFSSSNVVPTYSSKVNGKSVLGKHEATTLPCPVGNGGSESHLFPKRYRYSELYPDEVQIKIADPTEDPLQVLTDPLFDVPCDIEQPQWQTSQQQSFACYEKGRVQTPPQSSCSLQVAPTCTSHGLTPTTAARGQSVSVRTSHVQSTSQSVSEKSGAKCVPAQHVQKPSNRPVGSELSVEVKEEEKVSTVPSSKSDFLKRIDELLKKNEQVVNRYYTVPANILVHENLATTRKVEKKTKQKSVQKTPPVSVPKSDSRSQLVSESTTRSVVPKTQTISLPKIQHDLLTKIHPVSLPNDQPVSITTLQPPQPIHKPVNPMPQSQGNPKPNQQTTHKKPTPKVKCKYCNVLFDTKKEMDTHLEASLKTCMKFPCLICKTYFNNFVKFNEHMVDAHKTCKICDERFKSKYEYTLHEDNHKSGLIMFYQCSHCLNDYKLKKMLQEHILKDHPGKSVQEFQRDRKDLPLGCSVLLPRQCVYCDQVFASKKDLQQHLRSHNIGLGTKQSVKN